MPRKANKIETRAIPIRLSDNMIEGIDMAIKLGQGNDRNDVIRTAIANYLKDVKIIDEIRKKTLK